MRSRRGSGFTARGAVAVLALVSQLIATLGLPLPAAISRRGKGDGQPFPCQSRPCGCATAEECWRGDCCCFTLEEKVAWADANGVEPPPHVWHLLAARAKAPGGKPAGCCSSENCPNGTCDGTQPCCREEETSHSSADCPESRWVIGAFVQTCRGEGPAGSIHLEPTVLPALTFTGLTKPDETGFVA